MKIPHPIPYQGSKRNIADQIMRFYPDDFDRLDGWSQNIAGKIVDYLLKFNSR